MALINQPGYACLFSQWVFDMKLRQKLECSVHVTKAGENAQVCSVQVAVREVPRVHSDVIVQDQNSNIFHHFNAALHRIGQSDRCDSDLQHYT